MRARHPDVEGRVVRDGVTLGYEVYCAPDAADRPTILLLPTWTIIHTRFRKMQVPYLARHFRVVVHLRDPVRFNLLLREFVERESS